MKCLFCPNDNNNSDEHIILNSLNGKLHSKDIICSDCNNFFGLELDHVAKKYFNTVLLILGLKNASGISSENLEGDKQYLIQNDFKIRQVKLNIVKHTIDSKEIINISGEGKHVTKYFKKEVERQESKGKRLLKYNVEEIQSEAAQRIKVNFKVPPLFNTLLNKITLQYCQYHGVDLAEANTLIDKTRKLDTETSNIHYCNLNNKIREFNPYEITHLLVLKSKGKFLYAYVELFNVVCALVLLGENYSGEAVNHQYYQDAISGEKLQDKLDINERSIDKILTQRNFRNDCDFGSLVNKLFFRKSNRNLKETMDNELEKIKSELQAKVDNGYISDKEFGDLFIEKSTEMIAQLSIEFPYMIEDFDDANNDKINYIHSNLRENQFESFCKQYAILIGKEIELSNGTTFIIEKFTKVPFIEQNGIQIIRVLIVLYDGFNRISIPYRDFFEGIMIKEN